MYRVTMHACTIDKLHGTRTDTVLVNRAPSGTGSVSLGKEV